VNQNAVVYDLKPWVQQYGSAIPKELPPPRHANLAQFLRESEARYAKQTAFSTCMPNGMHGSLTYAQVARYSDAFAVYLRECLGLAAGARVALQTPNCLAYPVAAFGILKAGCVLVNTNPLYTPSEMEHQFADSGAEALVIVDMFANKLEGILPATKLRKVIVCQVPQFFPAVPRAVIRSVMKVWNRVLPPIAIEHIKLAEALAEGERAARSNSVDIAGYAQEARLDTLAALQYTGGTTGVSKGAMLTHGNLLSNVDQALAMGSSHIEPGKEVVLTALPLYHIFAFTFNLLCFYAVGARNVLAPNPRPIGNLQRAFENYPITWVSGVNTLFNALLNEEWFTAFPPRHLKAAVAGGAALQHAVAQRWERVTKTRIAEGYGLTEASPAISFNPLSGTQKPDSIGIPVPGNRRTLGGCRRATGTARCRRRTRRARTAGDGRLLEPPRGHRNDNPQRLAAHRRRCGDGFRRLFPHRRPHERHGAGFGLQCVSERDRGRDRADGRSAGSRRDRCPRSEERRIGARVRGAARRRTHRRSRARALPQAPDRLQSAEDNRDPPRVAENADRQDPAQGTARRIRPRPRPALTEPTMLTELETRLLGIMMMIIMLGMGSSLTFKDFRIAFRKPQGILVGLLCQYGIMPFLGYLMAIVLGLPPAVAVGLLLMGCMPGGTTSNIFTYFSKGTLALSIMMTVCSTLVAVLMVPLLLTFYGGLLEVSSEYVIPARNVAQVLIVLLVPTVIGIGAAKMEPEHRCDDRADRRIARRVRDHLFDRLVGAAQLAVAADDVRQCVLRFDRTGAGGHDARLHDLARSAAGHAARPHDRAGNRHPERPARGADRHADLHRNDATACAADPDSLLAFHRAHLERNHGLVPPHHDARGTRSGFGEGSHDAGGGAGLTHA
jgi:acyl-CoA synthetase (AMP-forming)/AMP-acid ligase II